MPYLRERMAGGGFRGTVFVRTKLFLVCFPVPGVRQGPSEKDTGGRPLAGWAGARGWELAFDFRGGVW